MMWDLHTCAFGSIWAQISPLNMQVAACSNRTVPLGTLVKDSVECKPKKKKDSIWAQGAALYLPGPCGPEVAQNMP